VISRKAKPPGASSGAGDGGTPGLREPAMVVYATDVDGAAALP
jgi:hypothetical protein